MKRFLLKLSVLLLMAQMVTFSCVASSGSVESDIDQQLSLNYRGKILTLRQPRTGNRLSFTYDGHPVGKAEECPWTVCAQIEVKGIRVDGRTLRILGRRLLLFFDPARKELRDAFSVSEKEEIAKHFGALRHPDIWRSLAKQQTVEIDVELVSETPDAEEGSQAVRAIFLSPGESRADVVPVFWRSYIARQEGRAPDETDAGQPVYKVKTGEVSAPRPVYTPDPDYPEPARKLGYSARVKLDLIVNPSGFPKRIEIAQPAGLGLDEKSVESVRQWKFDPGWKDGKPVAVRLNVETSFRLY